MKLKLLFISIFFTDIISKDDREDEDMSASSRTIPATLPMALPLKGNNKKPTRRYEDHYDEKGKDTKISKIFQLTVTALSFLAFGGYLLTLIIMAIRRNTNNGNNGNLLIFSVTIIHDTDNVFFKIRNIYISYIQI